MTANAITISSRLEAAGLQKKIADAIASEIVDFNNKRFASKADIVRIEGKIETIIIQVKILIGLVVGLYIGFALLFVDKIVE